MHPVEPTDWSDDDLPSLRRRNPIVAVVAVLVVFGLIAGVVDIVVRGPADGHTTRSVSETTAPTRPATLSDLDATVAAISDFVAGERELPFKRMVSVKLLDDKAFSARVASDALDDENELAETEGVLRALGLLPDDVSFDQAFASFLAAGVVGFYDPKTDELVVRGASLTPYVRVTLAHELTHALDDQYFELDRPALDNADDERGFAFTALAEGDAVHIQERYKASLPENDRKQADDEEGRLSAGVDLSSIPRVIPELIGFPYAFGPQLVDRLLHDGGEKRIDEAFANPPVTSEQIVDPDAWLANGAPPVHVPPPKADGAVFDQGALGFWGVYLLLEEELGQKDAGRAAVGWGGDWYVAWKQGSKSCVRATFAMDTRRDLDQLASALDDWAPSQDDATVTRAADRVSFTSCG